MNKIIFILILFPSILHSQINSDYKEIAEQKIKAIYFGDTTLEDFYVFLYDRDGFFIEKQIYDEYALYETYKFKKDGISREELTMCCLKHTWEPYKCIMSDTCSYIKVEYDEKLRLISKIQESHDFGWPLEEIGYEIERYECVDSMGKRFCSYQWIADGFWVLNDYDSIMLEEIKKKYFSIIELDKNCNDISGRTFMIYEGDTTPNDNSWNSEPSNFKKFYAPNGVLLAKEYISIYTPETIYHREEYAYRKNGELKRIVFYTKNIADNECIFLCDSLWYHNADQSRYYDIKNGGWISNKEIKCYPEYKKIKTAIPDYDDWLKWQKLTFHETLEFMYVKYPISHAFKIEYWD